MSKELPGAGEAPPLVLNGDYLPVHDLEAVARHGRRVAVSAEAMAAVARARRLVQDLLDGGQTAYGINTGFGELSHVRIDRADVAQLQVNLVRSHSVGVGQPLPLDVVRGMMLLRADSLSRGHSGVRPEVVERLVALLNARITPVVPEQGSVGASGDLAPLAHLASTLIGEGEVIDPDGVRRPAAEALAAAGLAPLTLEAKEGLALINGTQAMTATGALAWCDADRLHDAATAAAALSLEAMMGSFKPFDARFHAVRPHPGAGEVARNIRALTALSGINESHVNCARVQDPYSLRCIAPVLGASRDALTHAREVLEREMRSVTDNPLCFPDSGEILSGGNFHGQPVALVMDYMAIALAEIASFSERRTYLLLDGQGGLPEFLAARPGLQSGLMMAQYTAAALVSENKGLAHPASVDSIPTSAGMEDHVSMGMTAANKLRRVIANSRRAVAVELFCGAEALEYRRPLTSGVGVEETHRRVRERVARLTDDRRLSDDIERLAVAIADGHFRLASLLDEEE